MFLGQPVSRVSHADVAQPGLQAAEAGRAQGHASLCYDKTRSSFRAHFWPGAAWAAHVASIAPASIMSDGWTGERTIVRRLRAVRRAPDSTGLHLSTIYFDTINVPCYGRRS